jgi:hypothetical protein
MGFPGYKVASICRELASWNVLVPMTASISSGESAAIPRVFSLRRTIAAQRAR